jgi:hypothetical protein
VDPNDIIRNIFIWIAVPILGIAIVAAILAGKVKTMGLAALALVVGAAFVFMPAGTLQAIGASAAAGFNAFLNR